MVMKLLWRVRANRRDISVWCSATLLFVSLIFSLSARFAIHLSWNYHWGFVLPALPGGTFSIWNLFLVWFSSFTRRMSQNTYRWCWKDCCLVPTLVERRWFKNTERWRLVELLLYCCSFFLHHCSCDLNFMRLLKTGKDGELAPAPLTAFLQHLQLLLLPIVKQQGRAKGIVGEAGGHACPPSTMAFWGWGLMWSLSRVFGESSSPCVVHLTWSRRLRRATIMVSIFFCFFYESHHVTPLSLKGSHWCSRRWFVLTADVCIWFWLVGDGWKCVSL